MYDHIYQRGSFTFLFYLLSQIKIRVCREKLKQKKKQKQNKKFEEQNKSITYLERQEKVVEINFEWKKERVPEAFFFSETDSVGESTCIQKKHERK